MQRMSKQWWATEIGLLDGRRVLLRPIERDDGAPLGRLLEDLVAGSGGSTPRVGSSADDLARLTALDYVNQFAWVAQAIHLPGRPIVGVARYAREPVSPEQAEAAVTVVSDWRGAGLGETLLRFLALTARENGVRRLRGEVAPGAQAALGLLTKLGAQATRRPDGSREMVISLPRETGERVA